MSHTQFILLTGIVGFYAVLLAYLLLRICARSYSSLRPRAAYQVEKVFDVMARMRRPFARSCQSWHEQVVLDLTRIARSSDQNAAASRHPGVLC
jgi:uncharacterized membrane protein